MSDLWVFGYGSLIWRPGFDALSVRRARAHGYQRRFWQASHDHRGTPEVPGRVVTLVPGVPGACTGCAWQVDPQQQSAVLEALDHREKDGYERVSLEVQFDDGHCATATTWLAAEGNPSWAGDTGIEHIASIIASASGPSGSNVDYLQQLAGSLVDLQAQDSHVATLVEQVGQLLE